MTRVCGHYLTGEYVVVHDDNRMAAGEPCTTFYRLRVGEPVAELSFHCIPRRRAPVAVTTITTAPPSGMMTATRFVDLIEYQIAGDSEGHGVPPYDVHVSGR